MYFNLAILRHRPPYHHHNSAPSILRLKNIRDTIWFSFSFFLQNINKKRKNKIHTKFGLVFMRSEFCF